MANCPAVGEDLVVVATRLRLVPEKVNLLKVLLDKLEAVALVPALGKGVDGDLTADDKAEAEVAKLLLQGNLEGGPEAVDLVIRGKSVPIGLATTAAHRAQVDQAGAELDKGAPLDGQHQLGHVAEGKVDEALGFLLAQMGGNALLVEELAPPVGHQSVLGEDIIEPVQHTASLHLLGDFVDVRATDNAEGGMRGRPR